MKNKETITHAAVKTIFGWPILGKCHADCFHKGDFTGIEMSGRFLDQGFITNLGRYVGREEAFNIAFDAGQIDSEEGGVLCSEDLWSERHGGKYQYDYVKGYHK